MMIELLMAIAGLATGQIDVLGPAREGKLQCVGHDRARKTCTSLTTYTPQADGTYAAVMSQVIASKPVIVMETRSSVTVEGDAVCSIFHLADSRFLTDGKPVNAATERAVRKHLGGSMGRYEDNRVCSHHRATGDRFEATVSFDGRPGNGAAQPFIWIGADEGFTLAGL